MASRAMTPTPRGVDRQACPTPPGPRRFHNFRVRRFHLRLFTVSRFAGRRHAIEGYLTHMGAGGEGLVQDGLLMRHRHCAEKQFVNDGT
jgi:hypothetical protein